jgi:beta-xylosidase
MKLRKFVVFVLFSSLFVTSACLFIGTEPTPPPLPTPTNTPLPPPPTETTAPTDTPQPTAWHDNFEGAFALPWTWIDENPSKWSLTENPGSLRIYTAPYAGGGKNIMLLALPAGNFTATTHLFFEPYSNFQFAGLTLYMDDSLRANFGRAFCSPSENCVGNGLYFDLLEGGALVSENFATAVENLNETWLKLELLGDALTGSYSPDGVTWTIIGTHTLSPNFTGARIGLFAGADLDKSDDDLPAVFDFFDLVVTP